MRAWAKLAAAALGLLAATGAQAQLATVPEAALKPAATACLGLPADAAGARALLAANGWSKGEIKAGGGETVEGSGLEPYGKDGLLLLLTVEQGKVGCLIMAKVKRSLEPQRVVEGVSETLGRQPLGNAAEGAMWALPNGQAVMVRHVRTAKEATVQMIVTPVSEKKN